MALPIKARVEAAPNFLANLNAAHQFFQAQDVDTADARFARLKADIREMIAVLAWSPASGRPARFLSANSAQAKVKADAVRQLAEQAGLPHLREYLAGGTSLSMPTRKLRSCYWQSGTSGSWCIQRAPAGEAANAPGTLPGIQFLEKREIYRQTGENRGQTTVSC